MKAVIRMFALLVAIAGLASASFAPATMKAISQGTVTATGPGPLGLPGPLPCQLANTCLVPSSTSATR